MWEAEVVHARKGREWRAFGLDVSTDTSRSGLESPTKRMCPPFASGA